MATPNKDDNADKATEESFVETQEEETSVPEPSTEESQTASEEDSEAPETPEKAEELSGEEELTEEEKKRLSVKAQKRFSELSKKAKRVDELEKEVEASRQQQENEFTADIKSATEAVSQSQAPGRLPWEADLEKGEPVELSPDDYKRDVLTTADSLVQTRLAQARRLDAKENEIKSDLNTIQQKYEILNPDSSKYDEGLSSKMADLFQVQLRANPNVKLSDFVDTVMEVRQAGKKEGEDEVSAKLVEQKSEEALSPSEPEVESLQKPFESMSLDEKEKYLKDHGLWE